MDLERIVVGVDGSPGSWRALRWAAHQAENTGRSLLVAYLSESGEHIGDYGFGRELANDVGVALTRDHPALVAHLVLIEGVPARFLLDASSDAAMLVLGREPGTSSLMSLTSTLTEILARSACPVVVVGSAGPRTPGTRRIVLGVSGSAGGNAALRFACEEAVRTGTSVLALRVKSDNAPPAGDTPTTSSVASGAETYDDNMLATSLAEAHTIFPSVEICGQMSVEALRFALAREGHDASLIVLGCDGGGDVQDRELAPDTLVALYNATCAVAVVGPGRGTSNLTRQDAASSGLGMQQSRS